MDAQRTQTCMNCMHRHENQCRRYPPQVTALLTPTQDALGRQGMQVLRAGAWPEATEAHWCGEWAGVFKAH